MKYSNDVSVTSIGVVDLKLRYLLTLETENSEKSLLIITNNPYKADSDGSDDMVNPLITYFKTRYKTIYFTSLFPYYATKSEELTARLKEDNYPTVMRINDIIFNKILGKADAVMFAWGLSPKDRLLKTEFDKAVKYVVSRVTESGKPLVDT